MGFGFDILLVVLFFFGGGANAGRDALDLLPTDTYWQVKHVTVTAAQLENDAAAVAPPDHLDALVKDLESPEFKTRNAAKKKIYAMGPAALPLLKTEEQSADPEVKTAATDLVTRLEAHAKERDVRRLMAIRTLGERKEAGALALLRAMESSKELFVGEYAARAVAQIEGKPFVPADHAAAVAGDIALLPGPASVVGQCVFARNGSRETITLGGLVDMALDAQRNLPAGMNVPKPPAKDVLMRRAAAAMLRVVERVGDLRFDGVTLEVSADAGPGGGSAVIALRGLYDRDAVIAALQALDGPASGDPLVVTDEGAVKVLANSDTLALMPSDEQVIFVLGDDAKNRGQAEAVVLAALKGGPGAGAGTLVQDTQMQALLKTVDRRGPIWLALRPNADMRKEKVFAAFDAITLETKLDQAGMSFVFDAHGSDADLVKGSVDELKSDLAMVVAQGQMAAAQQKQLQPILDFLQAIKVDAKGKEATLSGEMKTEMTRAMLGSAGPMLVGGLGGMGDEADPGETTTQP